MRQAYQEVLDRIARAAESVGRDPASVNLVAVSKTHPADAVRRLYDLGHRDFGESRLQEALPKIETLPRDIRWHFVGTLQSNKARRVGENFDVVHTLATESAARELAKAGRPVDTLIEVNVANEPQKVGVGRDEVATFARTVLQWTHVRLRGLMTVGPLAATPEEVRPLFRWLSQEAAALGLPWRSMGMSDTYPVAIQEGATHVRVGTALFGARDDA